MTKVLMISTDPKILEEGSSVHERIKGYAGLFDELHVVVLGTAGVSRKVAGATAYPMSRIRVCIWNPPRVDVVTAQDPFETGTIARLIARRIKASLHLQIHTDLSSPYFRRGIKNRVRIWLSKKNLSRAKAVRAVSERIKRSLLSGSKVSVLPIWTDIEAIRQLPVEVGFKQSKMPFSKTILMASRLTAEKDISSGLRAFTAVSKEIPEAGLLIVGSGPELSGLLSLASALGIGSRIDVRPWAEHSEVIACMKTCDVFLSTSLFEGYGLSMLEAHAAGATLVVTDAGIASELTTFVCEPGDVECLSLKLREALLGAKGNRVHTYQYGSKEAYLAAFKADIERALL